LKAVLNKEWGLRSGSLLSHLALFDLPEYHKILALTDAAMNISPDLQEKQKIIENAVGYLNQIGIENPRVAVLSAVETVNPSIPYSLDEATLAKMSDRGQIKNCIIDGPFALDNAISAKSADIKKINSAVAGDADLLVGDDLDVSNAIYKSFIYFAKASCAAVIVGAKAPVVLTSRADDDQTKQFSISLAAAF
jgi:phosphate butyryltransferase